VGSAVGGILACYFVVPAISRRGFYTNAEYLEARFGPAVRVLSALIQIQYRTSLLGMMIWSAYLVLTRLVEISPTAAWTLILILIVPAGLYTAWGGLRSVVWTDTALGLVMIVAAVVIFAAVSNAAGGWFALEEKLSARDAEAGTRTADLMHIGRYRGDHDAVSPFVIVLGWTVIGSGYWTVNHTQTMRLMGSRSLRDMRYAALFGVLLSLPVMVVSACLGVFSHGIDGLPAMESADELYPYLANRFLAPGLKGLVVAGILAAMISTLDSMGSALSAIFTRDVYARLIAPDRDDRHYVLVGRLATAGVLLIGFAYLPFIWKQDHMLKAFTTLIPVFVTPLFTIYLAGVLTRVHRRSGLVGLAVGGSYGVIALVDRQFSNMPALPPWFTERWVALLWSVAFTFVPMLLTTLWLGREQPDAEERWRERGWLERSREELPAFAGEQHRASTWEVLLAAGALLLCGATMFLFW
jgi:SSS family solute:Na+ symporter